MSVLFVNMDITEVLTDVSNVQKDVQHVLVKTFVIHVKKIASMMKDDVCPPVI